LTQNVHEYLTSHKTGISLCDYTPQEATEILNDDGYFRFVVLRNPLNRAVSGYLEKFVLHAPQSITDQKSLVIIESAIDWVYRKRGELPDYSRSISFEEFVDYLVHNEDESLDTHFKSQESYLVNQEFDFVGAVEKMDRLIDVLKARINREFDVEHVNKIVSKKPFLRRRGLGKLIPDQIRYLQSLPHPKELLVRGIRRKLNGRFSHICGMWERSLRS
jgi:hypothetical protein